MQNTSVMRTLGSCNTAMVLRVKCWCDVMCSPPIQVLGLHLTYRTPKRVVFDSMVYNVLVYGEGQFGAYIPVAMDWIIQRKPTLASSRVCPQTRLHLLLCAISGEEGAILARFHHFCAGNIVTKVTGALTGVVRLYASFIGHRLFHIGEHREFPVISSVVKVLCCMC